MTLRRLARATAALPGEVETGPPAELFDPQHPVWEDQDRFLSFMRRRGWSLSASERIGRPTHPANRRRSAASSWALAGGVTRFGFPDWNQLRELGLIAHD
jgi:hypothetical protein